MSTDKERLSANPFLILVIAIQHLSVHNEIL